MGRAVRAPVEATPATLEIQSWQEKPQKGCPCIDFKKEKAYMCLLTCLLLGCEIKLESCSRSLFSSGSGTSNKQSLPKSKKLDTSSSTKRTTCLDTNAVSSSVRLRIYYLSRYLDASLASSADFSQASMHKFLFQNPPILGRI